MADLTKTDDIDWEDLLPKLSAYARYILRGLTWFRGKNTESFLKGKEIDDYVFEAIGEYLYNQQKYNPEKGLSLENYLKTHIIRRLITNDNSSKEHKTSRNLFARINDKDENGIESIEDLLPYIEATFDQQIDYDEVIAYVTERVAEDADAENIFMGLCHFQMKRGDIITEFDMTEQRYDNGKRRLGTILQAAATIYQLKAKKL